MQDETVRTAFTFAPILRHRGTDAARRITAVSLDTAAGRVFVGLANGYVEEHEIVLKQPYALDTAQPALGAHSTTRLVAEKRVSKQPVTTLACLPTAARLAILCEDGTASVASYDTWSVTALQGVRTAVAMAADPGPAAAAAAARRAMNLANFGNSSSSISSSSFKPAGAGATTVASAPPPRPVRMAVAVKSVTTAAKLLVYSIAPSIGIAAGHTAAQLLAQISLQDAVQDLIWVGSGLFVQHAMSYNLLQPGGRVTQIAEHGCLQPRMAAAPWPGGPAADGDSATVVASIGIHSSAPAKSAAAAARGALLFQDSLILLTDGNGAAVLGSEPISISEPPLALCSSGPFLVLLSDAEGVLVYDRACSRLVQRIFWAHDDPWVAAAHRIPVAEDAGGSGGVAVATSSAVMLLQPVALDVQARELLKRKRFDAALALIRSCRRAGEVWADIALAQAGLLLLQELRCEDALAALDEVGPATFQPAQLLPLFPRTCRRWLPALPHKSYWGLHGSLQSLDRICDDFLELRNSTGSSPRPSPSPPASLQGGVGGVTGAGGGPAPMAAAAAAAQLLLPLGPSPEASVHSYHGANHLHHHHHHHHHHSHRSHHHHHLHQLQQQQQQQAHGHAFAGDGVPSPAASALGGGGGGGGEVAALAADAKRHIVSYLLRNRGRPGVVCLEGIDTLLSHLLLETGDTAALEAFVDARGQGDCSGNALLDRGSAEALAAPPPGSSAGIGGTLGEAASALAAAGPLACVSPRDVAMVAALEGAGRWHALALLRAARGQVPQALELWQRLALGEVAESPSPSGAVAAAAAGMTAASDSPAAHRGDAFAATSPSANPDRSSSAGASAAAATTLPQPQPHPLPHGDAVWAAAAVTVASAAAATLMALTTRVPPLLCLSKLPWLLQAAPDWALHVLRSRPLPVADVMSLLQGRCDGVRWQYLHHLVYGGGAAPALPPPPPLPLSPAAAKPGSSGDGGKAVEPGSSGGTVYEAAAASEALQVAATSASVAWHLDPALHTELALEMIECIALLLDCSRQWSQQEQSASPQGRFPRQLQDAQQLAVATAPLGARAASVFASASAAPADAQPGDELLMELPPPLPPLPLPEAVAVAARHQSSRHEGGGAAAAAAAAATRTCSPPPMPLPIPADAAAMRHNSSAPHAPPAPQPQPSAQPRQHQHHGSQQPSNQTQAVTSPAASRPPTAADEAGSAGGGGGGLLVPFGSVGGAGGARYVAGRGGGAAAAAAAAAATAASAVVTAELPWLGALGVLPAAAVARQLDLAVRAARAAAGHNADPNADGAAHLELQASAVSASATATTAAAATAAAASGCLGDSLSLLRALSPRGDGGGMGTLPGLRAVLQHHLYCSALYDAAIVLQALSSNGGGGSGGMGSAAGGLSAVLLRERVQLHCRLEDHPAALAVLALQLRDVDAAICYCRARCGQEGWLALLDLLLRPGPGLEPDYAAACRVLAAEGAALAPLQVLEALSDDMPLHLAHGTLSRMMGSVLHRKRQGQVLRALHRAQNLALRAELAELQAKRVVVTEETLCRGCQRPLATQVFYRYPSGVVLCARRLKVKP